MSKRGKGSSTKTWIFIDWMVRTTFFSLEHLILRKLIAYCRAKVLNLLMQVELKKIWRFENFIAHSSFFFKPAIKFYLVT